MAFNYGGFLYQVILLPGQLYLLRLTDERVPAVFHG